MTSQYGYGRYAVSGGAEPGSRRRKLAAAASSIYRAGAAAASELKEQYNNTRIRNVESLSDAQVSIPGSFPNVSIVTKGEEQMVLFPSYAKRHVREHAADAKKEALTAAQMGISDEDYWRHEWARAEDETAVVDVDVRGWIYMPSKGPMTRRNRMLIGLARRLSGIPAPTTANAEQPPASTHEEHERRKEERRIAKEAREIERRGLGEKEVANRGGYSEDVKEEEEDEEGGLGLSRTGSRASVSELTETELAVANANLMARIGPFMTTPLVQMPITIFFYNDDRSQSRTVTTNDSGHFIIRAALDFVPTHVRVLANENISATEPVEVIEPQGVSLISDIDDTIKRSNINLGAREIFRNTFIRDLADLTIDGVRELYTSLHGMGVKIHYCSNSPWQLFPVLATYFHTAGLPPGSLHLKQYSGMLQGIFEPVAERKRGTLHKILRDFPERKFLLVGDSGEADLEVYTELVVANPGRILAVFIRDVTTPDQAGYFDSAYHVGEQRPATRQGSMARGARFEDGRPSLPPRVATAPPNTGSTGSGGPIMGTKAPPPRPAKPIALRGAPADDGDGRKHSMAGDLARTQSNTSTSSATTSTSNNNNKPPPPPPRRNTPSLVGDLDAAQGAALAGHGVGGGDQQQPINKKLDLWRRRLARAHESLDALGVPLYTWRRGEDVIMEAEGIVREALKGMGGGGEIETHRRRPPRLDRVFLVPRPPPSPSGPQPLSLSPRPAYGSLSMLNYVQLVGTPTADTPGACLLLHFDNKRYIFGHIAEGTQRLVTQRKIPLQKVQDIFLTGRIDWQSTGGLLGMILTIADVLTAANAARVAAKKPTGPFPLSIYGGKNLVHMMAAARAFIFRKGLPLRPLEIRADPRSQGDDSSAPDWVDENIKVWNVKLYAPEVQTGRKRKLSTSSHARDSAEEAELAAELAARALQQEEADQQLREGIIKDMFDSNWSLDALHETPLFDVKLPAAIFVRDEQGHIQKYEGPLPGQGVFCPNIPVLVRQPWPSATVYQLPETKISHDSMCYIVKNNDRRGKFNPVEALRLGAAKTDFKLLTAGQSVTTKDGSVITPGMVMEPSIAGHGFAIIDIRSVDLIDSLVARPEWSNPEIMSGIDAMYWITNTKVLQNHKLAGFMEQHSHLKHIILGQKLSSNHLAMVAPTNQVIKLNRVDPERFPLPVYSNEPGEVPAPLAGLAHVGKPGETIQFAPTVAFQDDKAIPFFDTEQPLQELAAEMPQVLTLADAACQKIADPAFVSEVEELEKDIPNRDTEVITLGTGSALPSTLRNVSATLVRVPGYGSYMLDCGENTLGQLRRTYGFSGADEVIKDLRVIYISHLHADHHLGTVSFLRHWCQMAKQGKIGKEAPRLAVVASAKFCGFLNEFKDVEGYPLRDINKIVLGGNYYSPGKLVPLEEGYNRARLEKEVGLTSIDACFVNHCHGSMAVVFTWPTGLKIAYSGDCRPSAVFGRIGLGAHLLIHECTFDDELMGDAIAKKHSTMSEAIGVGRAMGARNVLLTHFSQRYPKMPVMAAEPEAAEIDINKSGDHTPILFAFDYMRVKLGEFRMAEAFLPALKELFPAEEEDLAVVEDADADAEEPKEEQPKEQKPQEDHVMKDAAVDNGTTTSS
ncbi:hypothetical protein B0T22DRAFT_502005 [Podospora appendiculata]|uniref:ribonuclease Z n=1 Tax=Podospora appendiculata TaxID=314037 RepID=A0AAE0X1D4_9PEZI|nr:hypothetical protein B0T22DRAFT_502005 [Podospora appendiculata]